MEAKLKDNWDYLGWEGRTTLGSISQRDWNQTLITKINQISAQIHMSTLRGGANRVYLHPKSFMLVKDFEYFQYDKETDRKLIGNRFEVFIDDKLQMDKIYVKYHEKLFEKFLDIDKNYRMIVTQSVPVNEMGYGEMTISFLKTDDEKYNGFLNDENSKIISVDSLVGEITILNHNTIDPVTGEILIDYHTEISEDYWIPSPAKEIGQLVDLLPGATMEERTKKIKELLDKSKVLVNNVNEPTTKTFVVPIVKEEEKKIKISLFQRLKNIINKTK